MLLLLAGLARAHLEILVYGPTASWEEDYLTDIPTSVTVWSDSEWRKATAKDFEKFHVILVGDKGCGGPSSSDYDALYATRKTWQPWVHGNVVVMGINPACHSGKAEAGDLLYDAASWAGGGGGGAGMVVFSDFGTRDLDFLDYLGSFDSERRKDDKVTIGSGYAGHRVFDTSTSTDLSGWGDSNASYFKTVPSGWNVMARDSKGDPVVVGWDGCDLDSDGYLGAGRCGGTDCLDTDSTVSPIGVEWCNSLDDDCDGSTDESDATDAKTWYRDADKDTYGDRSSRTIACKLPAGYVADSSDCDDTDSKISPVGVEVCNRKDDDCDGIADERDALDVRSFWFDWDADGYGDPAVTAKACWAPSGWVDNDDDCDDTCDACNPAARDIPYDDIDQNCDGADLCDVDLDGFDAEDCGGDDCADDDPDMSPGEVEVYYDGIDADCDGRSDDDADRDGDDADFAGGSDCDDADDAVYGGAPEIPDGKDNDCNGFAEDDDTDGDGIKSEEELRLGTPADDPDADDDGLADGEELVGGLLVDSDGDGVDDVFDDDDDGDGLPTADEIGSHAWRDPLSSPDDRDRDGLADHLDLDSDNDGWTDTFEGLADFDGDGLSDAEDTDSDGDGLADQAEIGDTDGDGIGDRLSPDDDGDGLPTALEGAVDSDGDGTIDAHDLDSDADGHPDRVEGAGDFDRDGRRDSLDLDSDADGLVDEVERGDSDGDGQADRIDLDDDEDGVPTLDELIEGQALDFDKDGLADALDPDSDGDGFGDGDEPGDSDQDGQIDRLDLDSDADGVFDVREGRADTDNDGLPDRIDRDDDGDGLWTWMEGEEDPDQDGAGNHVDLDADGDGVADATEGWRDVDCDEAPDFLDPNPNDGPCAAPGQWADLPKEPDLPEPDVASGCNVAGQGGGPWWMAVALAAGIGWRRRR